MPRVSVTRIRPELNHWIRFVQEPEAYVVLTSHGREVAALVSMDDLRSIWAAQDERLYGPIDPATGRPFGRRWVQDTFRGVYRRESDPDAHLHPSRDEAPRLGRPFDWPPVEDAPPAPPDPPTEDPQETPAEAPTPTRTSWRFWRRR